MIIQGHLDMVCEKRPGSTHDFKKDGLELYVEDGFVKAKDTTLGADDGIAVAMAMALLDSDDIPHSTDLKQFLQLMKKQACMVRLL